MMPRHPKGALVSNREPAGAAGYRLPCRLVDEQVFAGLRERVHGRTVRADQMHPADSIEGSIRSDAIEK